MKIKKLSFPGEKKFPCNSILLKTIVCHWFYVKCTLDFKKKKRICFCRISMKPTNIRESKEN